MAYSNVAIINMALAQLGKMPIRSLTEENEVARRCAALYPISRDYVLSRGNWSFARKTAVLQQVSGETHPNGLLFALPSDCLSPRFITPRGQKRPSWRLEGRRIIIPTALLSESTEQRAYLTYTKYADNEAEFTIPFVRALSAELVATLTMPFTKDVKAATAAREQAEFFIDEMLTEDANRGSDYREIEEDPRMDSFVDPDATQAQYYGSEDI